MRPMADLTLGTDPDGLTVKVAQGVDFNNGFDSIDGPWPVGAQISLVFKNGTEWPATIDGYAVDWRVDKAQVDALLATLPQDEASEVRLMYRDGDADLLWAEGWLEVRRW